MLGIYGAGGLGREIYDLAVRINEHNKKWDNIVFIDDNKKIEVKTIPIYEFEEFLCINEQKQIIIAVGDPKNRYFIYEKIIKNNLKLAILKDPNAIVSNSAHIESGVIISEFCTIHSNVVIKTNSLIQPFCCIGHDIEIGRHTVISTTSNIGGGSTIKDRVLLGMNCSVLQNIVIESDSLVAMGSVVFRDVPEGATVLGNPARVTKAKGNEP